MIYLVCGYDFVLLLTVDNGSPLVPACSDSSDLILRGWYIWIDQSGNIIAETLFLSSWVPVAMLWYIKSILARDACGWFSEVMTNFP